LLKADQHILPASYKPITPILHYYIITIVSKVN
jgi:hypothetical protein